MSQPQIYGFTIQGPDNYGKLQVNIVVADAPADCLTICWILDVYCKISNISHTKSQNLNDYHHVLQLSLPNPLKPEVKLRIKM